MIREAAAVLALVFATAANAQIREIYVPGIDYPEGVTPGPDNHRVRVRYELNPDGRVARCTVSRGSGQSLLDAESCRILETRARIRPEPGMRRGQLQFVWMDASSLERPYRLGGPLPFALYQSITSGDYPQAAVDRRESGATAYEVDVSAAGRPTACRVTQSSGSEALDERTCALVMRRGAFIPAAAGAGTAFGTITWRMPGG